MNIPDIENRMVLADDNQTDLPSGREIYRQLPNLLADDLALDQCGERYKGTGKMYIAAILDASAWLDQAYDKPRPRDQSYGYVLASIFKQIDALQAIIHDMKDSVGESDTAQDYYTKEVAK